MKSKIHERIDLKIKSVSKTTTSKVILLLIILSGVFSVSTINAQIANPYPMTNSLPCDIRVAYEIDDYITGGGFCKICENGNITIPANSTVWVGYSCANITDFYVSVFDVGGTPVSGNYEVGYANPTVGCIWSQNGVGPFNGAVGNACTTSISGLFSATGTTFW